MTDSVPTARAVVETLLRTIVESPAGIADLYAQEVLIEMPFAPPLYPVRNESGREQLRAQIKAGAGQRAYTGVKHATVYETTDPEVVIAEYELHGRTVADGRTFVLPMLMILTVRDGLIVSSRDYSSPVLAAQALGRVPELVAALKTAQGYRTSSE